MKYAFTLLLVLSVFSLQAQTSFGILSGYNRSWEKYDVEVPDDARTHIHGWNLSAYVSMPVGKRFAVNTEAGYIERGAACVPGWTSFNQDTEIYLGYGQLATSLSYEVLRKNRLSLNVYLGGSASHLLSGRETFEDTWSDVDVSRDLELGDEGELNRFDFGAQYGLLLKYRVGCGEIVGRAGGYRGFRDVNRENFSRSRDLVGSVGYLWSL